MLVALNAVLALAISLAVAWLASMLLPLRHPVAFWAVTVSQFPVVLRGAKLGKSFQMPRASDEVCSTRKSAV